MKTKKLLFIPSVTLMMFMISSCSENQYNVETEVYSDSDDINLNLTDRTWVEYESGELYTYIDLAEEDDMSAELTYHTSDGNIIHISRDSYGNISGYDMNGNFIYGYSDQYGNTTTYDLNGSYLYSHTDDNGYTTSHDLNGNYIYSHTDDYGYSSGYDLKGNYYNARTDDYGYTTVSYY